MIVATLLAAAAFAAPLDGPFRVDADLAAGMRIGGAGVVTVEPVRYLEVGGYATLVTDWYAMSPDWVRVGLHPRHNLRLGTMAAAGPCVGGRVASVSLLGLIGTELIAFRESRDVPALPEPATYGTTELALVGGVLLDVRFMVSEHWGGNLITMLPLPFSPTGSPNIERVHAGLGLSYRSHAPSSARE